MCRSRRSSRKIHIGPVAVGGCAPVSVQTMCCTDTREPESTLRQIRAAAAAGCEIIRVAVPDMTAAEALQDITSASPLPVVADIHFDYRLALRSIASHAAEIRLNPGNLANAGEIRQVALAAGEAGIPIRVGANAGSVKPELLHLGLAEALTVSALEQCALLEQYGFHEIKVSLKASSVPVTVAACRAFAARSDYPLHIGVTEAGTPGRGIIKSAVGIGALLLEGIGDTIRVSLTADPMEEVRAGIRILESCGLRDPAPEIVSCPTCGRTEIDLAGLANRVEDLVAEIKASGMEIQLRKIAVMGCVVNGPGEARDADIGLAGGRGKVVLFRHGEKIGTFDPEAGFAYLADEIRKHAVKRP